MMQGKPESAFCGEHDAGFSGFHGEFRQGDVLQYIDGSDAVVGAEVWTSHLAVIVTANCDLAHEKHGGILSCVPVVPLREYAANVTIPRVVEDSARRTDAELRKTVPATEGWTTVDRLYELLREGETPSGLSKYLPRDAQTGALQRLLLIAESCVLCETALEASSSWPTILSTFGKLLLNLSQAKNPSAETLVRKELRSRLLKSLPGDALFLAAPARHLEDGYIAYLRIIREVRLDQIATSPVEERRRPGVRARRVGCLRPTYLHRLTQQMAAVFTSIGLPGLYEEHRAALSDLTFDEWAETMTKERDE
ncbi:MAG: hypothetical protein ACRBN8_30045 [Nannocystales bacterium]